MLKGLHINLFAKATVPWVIWTVCFFLYYHPGIAALLVFIESNVAFLFTANYSEYKQWYPNWHLLVFFVFRIFPFILILLCSFLLLKIIQKKGNKILSRLIPFFELNFMQLLFNAVALLLFWLFVYYTFQPDFTRQLIMARCFVLTLYMQLLLTVVFNFNRVKNILKQFLFVPALPYTLSIFRILFYAYSIIFYLGNSARYFKSVASGTFTPMPIFGELFYVFSTSLFLYQVVFWLCIASFIGVIIGYKTRLFLILSAVLSLFVISVPNMFGTSWHHHLFIWVTWFLVFSPCFDVYSIDSYLNKNKTIRLKGEYTFTIRIIWLQIGILYWCSGVAKLWDSGFDWALSDSMINQFQLEWFENYNKVPYIRIDRYPALMKFGGLAAICFEMLYFFFLFKKYTRRIAIWGALLMHNLLGYFLYISFLAALQAFYIVFIDWNKYFKSNNVAEIQDRNPVNKWNIRIGIGVVLMNLFFGMASIKTYPFSGYPEYSEIIPDYTYQLKLTGYNDDKIVFTNADFEKEGFDWETFRRREQKIANVFLGGNDCESYIRSYWSLINQHIRASKDVRNLDVSLLKVNLNPDSLKILDEKFIGSYSFAVK